MKIEKVIFTIDDNPHYRGFWSSISRHYKERMGILPVLYIIGDESSVDMNLYDKSYGEVRFFQKVNEVPTIIQALIGKFYLTILEPETTWLIGDLDLYPLQQYHFKDMIRDIDEDSYVHLNPYAYGVNWRDKFQGLAGYFHVAKGKVFGEELNFNNKTFEDVCLEIFNSDKFGIKFYNIPAGEVSKQASPDWGWFCCEEMYTGFLLRNSKKLVETQPISGNYNRLDRSYMFYNLNDVSNGKYIDFHSPRPYEQYKNIIEEIVKSIPLI